MSNVRKMTNKILQAIEEGYLTEKQVINACLNYMSESEVDCMASDNCFFDDEEDDEEEDDNRFNYSYDDDDED